MKKHWLVNAEPENRAANPQNTQKTIYKLRGDPHAAFCPLHSWHFPLVAFVAFSPANHGEKKPFNLAR
jgi:hypothetical protein